VENLKLVNDLSAGWAFPAPARPEPPAVPAATIKTFLLRNVPAEEAARVLDELFQGQKSLRIAAHARSNTVFVQGAPADLIVVEAVVTRLDTAAQPPPPSPKDPLTKRDAARVMVAEAEADVRQWQDRVTWIDRMVQKGYATADQAQRDRASLKKAEAALAAAKGGVEKAPAPAAGVPPQTTRLQDLHQERLAILRAVADQVSEAHRRGETHQAAVLEANLAVLQAELDACATDQERLPVLEKLAAAARAQEDRIAALVKAGNVSSTHLQQARVKRLEAEIALEKARRK
jgi:hypothetical protein